MPFVRQMRHELFMVGWEKCTKDFGGEIHKKETVCETQAYIVGVILKSFLK
jgi:hypothetical protein